MSISLSAYCLPNQLERVTDTAYSYYWADGGDREDLRRQMAGGIERFQAPTRFCAVIKRTMDRDSQPYGFVVGHAEGDGLRMDSVEVERTLDLFPI
jgi:hypothetical protein